MAHTTNHLRAIESGCITKRNVIGLKKALNADARRERGYSVSITAPKYTHAEVIALQEAVQAREPRVIGELHESGLKLLRSPRYRKRLAEVQDIINNLESFRLVGFEHIDNYGFQSTPVYRACAGDRSFVFRNIPWQSGGNGPEII